MSQEHVLDQAFEFAEQRLVGADAERVERHLSECGECRDHVALVRRLLDDAAAGNARHLRPERLVAFSEVSAAALEPQEKRHLELCNDCQTELAWARAEVPPEAPELDAAPTAIPDSKRISKTPSPVPSFWSWLDPRTLVRVPALRYGAFGMALAALVLTWWTLGPVTDGGLPRLARIEALPIPSVERGGAESLLFTQQLARAARAYGSAEYAEAASAFRAALEIAPERADVRLYLGSSLNRSRLFDEARIELTRAAAEAQSAALREEAHWQLALASLSLRDRAGARNALEVVVRENGVRRAAAARLLRRLS